MIIATVGESESNIERVELPHADTAVDPRPIAYDEGHTYSFSVNGTTLIVTRTDKR